jgi:hypothetical protein
MESVVVEMECDPWALFEGEAFVVVVAANGEARKLTDTYLKQYPSQGKLPQTYFSPFDYLQRETWHSLSDYRQKTRRLSTSN